MRKIYLASSWRNSYHPYIYALLKQAEHEVYNFKTGEAFHWSEIDPQWQLWTPEQYVEALVDPIASRGYARDKAAMDWADTCVLLMPCGRSAHLEAGYMAGQGKQVIVVVPEAMEPELMYRLLDTVVTLPEDLLEVLERGVS